MLQTNPALAIAAILLAGLPAGIRTRVGARETMERTGPVPHRSSQESVCPILLPALMKRSRTSRHIAVPPNIFLDSTRPQQRRGGLERFIGPFRFSLLR